MYKSYNHKQISIGKSYKRSKYPNKILILQKYSIKINNFKLIKKKDNLN